MQAFPSTWRVLGSTSTQDGVMVLISPAAGLASVKGQFHEAIMENTPTDIQSRLEASIAALEHQDLAALRATWARHFGPPPKLRSVELLRFLIAWRFQAERYGGLDPDLRAALRRKGAKARHGEKLGEGAVLRRDWNGQTIEVVVAGGRFHCDGRSYSSLSAVATAVTGTRWNGARFFGLKGVRVEA